MQISTSEIDDFITTLSRYYDGHGRHDMLWRQADSTGYFTPYKIMVSELMLQQTQVARVTEKYVDFLTTFPEVQSLAKAELREVLQLWNGLGYNRRAKFIWQAARMVCEDHDGSFPDSLESLVNLPGIGPNTAGAIMAYAYNQPVIFIETNIRTVIIHHFYAGQTDIPDVDIRQAMEQILPRAIEEGIEPRQFYWSMMDYGSHLKATVGNLSRHSKHYAKQSTFEGSKRQLRGAVIRELTTGARTAEHLIQHLPDERLTNVINELLHEGMIKRIDTLYKLS